MISCERPADGSGRGNEVKEFLSSWTGIVSSGREGVARDEDEEQR
jgi:hypothetical protein